ncbi:MAG TPA: LacI family DNA-binding transcriptional regulator [Steroidobacteraceae bacterium]|nr:LacI family DNA-binding transcriptional regulator [Steroidobacteraceae bacterium]
MATIKDLAAKVGVSVATVSNVLNDKPNVGATVRQKVLRAAKELGYRPHRAAQAMRKGRTRAIGLVLPDLTNPFFPQLAQAVESTARNLGLLVCLIDSQGCAEGETDGLTLLSQHGVDGIIWCPVGPHVPAPLRTLQKPVVLIDRPKPGFAAVHSNYVMGGQLLARYALQQGHTRIALLSGPSNLESAQQRRNGFLRAFPKRMQIAWEARVGFDGILTREARDALLRRQRATLIVAGNDLIAINAIRFLAEHNVNVPDDVSVTGFDDIGWARIVTPRLTTIAQPLVAIGTRAVELLQERMSGATVPSRATVFDVALVERESVKNI